ncbi:malate synthase G [Opitutia bacterium ISCC 51]|nr:malate synthase G [Opitutae bacterium ISCC 51]QXD26674.1 malate synthase G [Opitutae bacterium ISCC 52]
MSNRIEIGGLKIGKELYELVENEIAPGTGVEPEAFWKSLDDIVQDLLPINLSLLEKRDALQAQIDQWHADHPGATFPNEEYKSFLTSIGYLLPEGDDFQIETTNVDAEISIVPGPQLVVPVNNARYALNATNARWGSLYDALYGTNVIPHKNGLETSSEYNPARGSAVIEESCKLLDQNFPLAGGIWNSVTHIALIEDGTGQSLSLETSSGNTMLADAAQFAGFNSEGDQLTELCLKHNGLHVILQIDREHPIGKASSAGIKDVILESAITTIQDFEDSVSAVDTEDKVEVYRNWTGLMKGTLNAEFSKGDKVVQRAMKPDREFTTPSGDSLVLKGRSLLLARNVGIHMFTNAVMLGDGSEIPEGILDAMVSSLATIHDIKGLGKHVNSQEGSFYVVKPKQHGPEEVAFTATLFSRVEEALGLERNSIKMGIMDEERSTSINLKACIREAKERIVFINTGFLDRTGDEIHTSMNAGLMLPKMEIKSTPWILAYEDWNVDLGLETGLQGKAQIGKGMWTAPDDLKTMMETKEAHPEAGANTAWVPSPTAATLHALHYHSVNVFEIQDKLASRARASLDDLLTPPLLDRQLSPEEIQSDLDNNAQGILGYVVRWIDQGVGCSKVPDIHNVGLMEDRATLRISSQHIANWLHHGLVKKEQVMETFQRMAGVVDEQNEGDSAYISMAGNFDNSIAFQAALDLVFKGVSEANGYTEPVLHRRRKEAKALNRR